MWFVVIFFASWNLDGSQNIFLFNNPVYETELECRATLTDRDHIEKYVTALIIQYNGMLPGAIEKANCIDQKAFDFLMEQRKLQEGDIIL